MKAFELINSPVNGRNLIEASAGTGKTYTITAIFLRLILETQLSVEQILVVTFTEAATAELKERIRNRLKEAQNFCITGKTDDLFVRDLMACQQDKNRALSLLAQAIRSFDQASIFTIHGFCYRVLNEHAFESGSMFDTELVTDQREFKQEIVEDFWRSRIYTEPPLFVNFFLDRFNGPEELVSFNDSMFSHKKLKIIPENSLQDTSDIQEKYKHAFDAVAGSWKSSRQAVEDILLNSDKLKRNIYKKNSMEKLIRKMDIFTRSTGNSALLFDGFDKFTQNVITNATNNKYKQDPPVHAFFDLCEALRKVQEQLIRAFQENLISLKIELIEYMRTQLAIRKKEQNIRSFDDLLQNLDHVLNNESADDLIRSLRHQYKAALIDEFQDTDPIQYNIFNKLFNYKTHTLFLIGDPKQAIYGFRGADIFTYMSAAERTESRYTLNRNWRSDGALVNAINNVFNNVKNPFVFKEIGYSPVSPALKTNEIPLQIDGKNTPPFTIWHLPPENQKPVTKTLARERITHAVTSEISRLLHLSAAGKATLGKNKIQQGDIAVLVRRNAEAEVMQQALSDLNIKSVIYSNGNIFDSAEAFEMERMLRGILSPNRESALKSALTTQMMGYTGNTLFEVMQEESRYEECRERFRMYRQLWHTQGFIRMFNYFMQKENVLPGMMAFMNGERRCTNIRHLVEILHETSMREHPGMEELTNWLSRQRHPDRMQVETHQLRLESDENAVKIVTVHKSKGLEYPIVFCPFMWDGSNVSKKADYLSFHDPNDRERLILDFGWDAQSENIIPAEKEILAENMRLLYVALTRAKACCCLVMGTINDAETSAPAYILNQFGKKEDISTPIRELVQKAGKDMSITALPSEEGIVYAPSMQEIPDPACRCFTGHIERDWQFSSFTSLVHNPSAGMDFRETNAETLQDHDEFHEVFSPEDEQENTIFSFPKGATSGTCLHDIFEHLDFTNNDTLYQQQLVAEKLQAYGFDLKWQDTVTTMIQRVLQAPLNKLDKTDPPFTLSSIPPAHRMNELEFYFPVPGITSEALKNVLTHCKDSAISKRYSGKINQLNMGTIKGFLKGFVDLVFKYNGRFYILDWKSNFLGSHHNDYLPEMLEPVMENDFYFLQYLIYTIAVNRFLENRDPSYTYETGFGGVYYMFLRGIDPATAPGCGIYYHRPDEELIRGLSDVLMDKGRL